MEHIGGGGTGGLTRSAGLGGEQQQWSGNKRAGDGGPEGTGRCPGERMKTERIGLGGIGVEYTMHTEARIWIGRMGR